MKSDNSTKGESAAAGFDFDFAAVEDYLRECGERLQGVADNWKDVDFTFGLWTEQK